MAVLVTGGAGFIGSACVAHLVGRGEDVVVLDDFETLLYGRAEKERNVAWALRHGDFELIEADIRDERAVEGVFERHPIDGVIHLAAVAGVRNSIAYPDLYCDINVTGTARLMRLGLAAGVRRWVIASSSSVYAGNTKTPFSESDTIVGQVSPYGATKFATEAVAQTMHHLAGPDAHVAMLRFFTVYGPRQRPDMAFHKFLSRLANGEAIPMFGDGSSGRDYTYIDDIVSGVIASLDRPSGFKVYNLGGDEVHRLRDVIALMGEITGREPVIDQLPEQPGDVHITSADISLARRELEFEPKTPLAEGIAQMWAWYKKEHGLDD